MSDFSALNTAITGLYAHRQRIDVIGENIANIDTPGYHRQVTELTAISTQRPGLFSGSGGEHGGVSASVNRRWDELLENSARQEQSRASSLETQAGTLERLETEIGSLDAGGLADRLQKLWDAFDDLANDPKDLAVRNVVLGNAEAVASTINNESSVIDAGRGAAVDQAKVLVTQINQLSSSIALLDKSIVAGVAAGNPPNGLIDQRDARISELASMVDVQVAHQETGQVRISIGGHNLVADGQQRNIELLQTPDTALGGLGYQRVSVVTPNGTQLNIAGGSLHGTISVANDLMPEQRRALDGVAASIVSTVNALHMAGAGLDGSTGFALFDPAGTTAATMAVSVDLRSNPERLAASDGSAALDNKVALALAALGTDPNGPTALHTDMLTTLGNRVRTISDRARTASLASGRAAGLNQAAVGVNLDEELADLVSAQRSYEASARMISAIDEMLDTLINRTGLVGR